MARNWVEFDEGPKLTDRNRLYVSINKDAEILINRHTYEQMNEPAAVVLLFDSSTYTIGLRPAIPLAPNAFPVRQKGKHGNRLISVRGFVDRHELKRANTVRFLTPAIEDGVLVLEYRRTANVSRNSKPGRR
ncbi:MAG TPA: hypothetical protein VEV84_00075 [Pyrinomonadaceae bacterium]|nr:hypothetical protein [Pyrinomonadaceae bacterium]